MSQPLDVRLTCAPPPPVRAGGLVRWVCTSNPFYVLSAGLFLVGLYASFGAQSEADTWALMAGLGGYTTLLALAACLLVRYLAVWDDARTVLLLVVLMFLATSVTFDEVLVLDPERGHVCYLAGLLFALGVSDAVLRGIRLTLPALYRVPYYLILALFFLYPLALAPLLSNPDSEELMWVLFGFSTVAGFVFLTLLPAIRRGEEYVRDNGSPWRWPLYPWALFGLLGLAVPARAFLLCWSMHLLGAADRDSVIFGPYFLVPFGLAVSVLLLEAGVAWRRAALTWAALAAPAGLAVLSEIGHRDDPVYRLFLETFAARLGGGPLAVTLLASAAFYWYAAMRGVRPGADAMTAALAALAFTDGSPRPEPLLAAALVQLGLGAWRRESWRCLAGAAGLVVVAFVALPSSPPGLREAVAAHVAIAAVLAVGAAFDGALARRLRLAGAAAALTGCVAATFLAPDRAAGVPGWARDAYGPAVAALLLAYGLMLRHPPSLAFAALAVCCWLSAAGWRGYWELRQVVSGLDYLALSLTLFVVAVLVSLFKAGALSRRLPRSAD